MASKVAMRLPGRLQSAHHTLSCQGTRRVQLQWRARGPKTASGLPRLFASTSILQEKKYTRDHEWVEMAEDGKTGIIGITTFAAKALGDVVFVELPTQDLEANAGDSVGAVESVKSAADIHTPVGGKVIEANDILQEKPGTINKGPEAEGWVAKIELADKGELNELMTKEEYDKFTAEE